MIKKIIKILVIIVMLITIKILVIPEVFTPQSMFDMSDKEYNQVLEEVQNNNNSKLIKLYSYYRIHQEETNLCMVLCKIVNAPKTKEGYKKQYKVYNCNTRIICDDNILLKLEKHN